MHFGHGSNIMSNVCPILRVRIDQIGSVRCLRWNVLSRHNVSPAADIKTRFNLRPRIPCRLLDFFDRQATQLIPSVRIHWPFRTPLIEPPPSPLSHRDRPCWVFGVVRNMAIKIDELSRARRGGALWNTHSPRPASMRQGDAVHPSPQRCRDGSCRIRTLIFLDQGPHKMSSPTQNSLISCVQTDPAVDLPCSRRGPLQLGTPHRCSNSAPRDEEEVNA